VYDIILTVSQAFHANSGYTEELTRGLVRKPLQAQPVSIQTDLNLFYYAKRFIIL
jgi:hypothetical protein